MKKRKLWLLTAWLYTFCGAWLVTASATTNNIVYAAEVKNSEDDSASITGLLYGDWEYMIAPANTVVILCYHGTETELVIPDTIPVSEDDGTIENYTVTEIYTEAFKNNTDITNIQLPATVTRISEAAFSGCTSLTTVHWTPAEDAVITIEKQAFENCTNLNSAVLPDCQQLAVGYRAFAGCNAIDSVFIPVSWQDIMEEIPGIDDSGIYGDGYIRGGQFMDCTGIESVGFEDGLSYINAGMFCGCTNLNSVYIPDSIVDIEALTFMNCLSLTTIELPNSIMRIYNKAFDNSGLTTITLPGSVRTVGDSAFDSCKDLTDIHIPAGLKIWGDNVLLDCNSNLKVYTSMTADNNPTCYEKLINDLTTTFGTDFVSTNLLAEGVDTTETYTFQPTVDSEDLWEYQLKQNLLGETVAVITGYTNNSDEYLDKYIISVPSVVVQGEDTYLVSEIGDYALMGYCGNTVYHDIVLPDTITTIGDSSFASIPGLRIWVPYSAAGKISTSAFSGRSDAVIYTDSSDIVDYAIAEGIQYIIPITHLTFDEENITYTLKEECETEVTLPVLNIFPKFLNNVSTPTYSSSNEDIAWISEDGDTLYVYKEGTAIITVSATNELTGEVVTTNCNITITVNSENKKEDVTDPTEDPTTEDTTTETTTTVQQPSTNTSETTTEAVKEEKETTTEIVKAPKVLKVKNFKVKSIKKKTLSLS